ncbi:MAG: c-type cytochrome [Acidobacteria bacterium]|nr:c-type cytochrome [Acidobacteriota bacterium]
MLIASTVLLAHGEKPWPVPAAAKKRKNPVPATPESLRQGAALYRSNCLVCHGAKGKGDGPWVEKLPAPPSDLSDTPMMGEMTDGEIFWKISQGRGEMPRFELQLDERQRWHLVNYLRTLVESKPGAQAEKEHKH